MYTKFVYVPCNTNLIWIIWLRSADKGNVDVMGPLIRSVTYVNKWYLIKLSVIMLMICVVFVFLG